MVIDKPTIDDLTNATHDHSDNANGGVLSGYQPSDNALTEIAARTWDRGDVIVTNALGELADLPIGTSGQVLTSDGTDVSWATPSVGSLSTDDLTDVDTTTETPAKNDVLMYNGTNFVPVPEGTVFTFSIATFTDNQSTTQEIGSGTWVAIGAMSFSATYNNPPPTNAYVSHSGWSNLTMTGTDFQGATLNTQARNYPASPGSLTFTLNATDGTDADTKNIVIYFYNRRFWGVTTTTSGFTEANIESLASNELSNSRSKTFTVAPTSGQYICYSYPSRLGTATFTVGGFEGGFESPETVSVTNASGYTENYYVYRSTNDNLGSTSVVVS